MYELKDNYSKSFGNIRTVVIDNNRYFVGKDVCNGLNIRNYQGKMKRLSEEEKKIIKIQDGKLIHPLAIITSEAAIRMVKRYAPTMAPGFTQWIEADMPADFEYTPVESENHFFDKFTVFSHDLYGNIREIMINGEFWFVGVDVAKALGYKNPYNAIKDNVDSKDILCSTNPSGASLYYRDSLERLHTMLLINETGLYSLIFRSKLDSASEFKRWIFKEVLPTLRSSGTYTMGNSQASVDTNSARHDSMVAELLKNISISFDEVGRFMDTATKYMENCGKRLDKLEHQVSQQSINQAQTDNVSPAATPISYQHFYSVAISKLKLVGKKYAVDDHAALGCIYRRMTMLGADLAEVRDMALSIDPTSESSVLKQIALCPSCHSTYFKAVEDIIRA